MATDLTHQPTHLLDLSGLPEPVVQQVTRIVREAREQQAAGPDDPSPLPGRLPLRGRFAHLGYSFPKEELDEAQREMWATFPRDLPDPPKPS